MLTCFMFVLNLDVLSSQNGNPSCWHMGGTDRNKKTYTVNLDGDNKTASHIDDIHLLPLKSKK